MIRKLAAAMLLGAVFTAPATAVTVVTLGASEGVTTDGFNGATVVGSSALLNGFNAASAFGAVIPAPDYPPETVDGNHVIFAGNGSQFINFTTAAPVTISGFNIYLSSDGPGTAFRGFNSAGLSYSLDSGLTFISLGSISYDPTLGPVTVTGTFGPVTASYFRFDADDSNGGGRVYEIDAIDAVPEPASWAMMVVGFGMAGFAMRARRSARALA